MFRSFALWPHLQKSYSCSQSHSRGQSHIVLVILFILFIFLLWPPWILLRCFPSFNKSHKKPTEEIWSVNRSVLFPAGFINPSRSSTRTWPDLGFPMMHLKRRRQEGFFTLGPVSTTEEQPTWTGSASTRGRSLLRRYFEKLWNAELKTLLFCDLEVRFIFATMSLLSSARQSMSSLCFVWLDDGKNGFDLHDSFTQTWRRDHMTPGSQPTRGFFLSMYLSLNLHVSVC